MDINVYYINGINISILYMNIHPIVKPFNGNEMEYITSNDWEYHGM
jgi:hypothetical protein